MGTALAEIHAELQASLTKGIPTGRGLNAAARALASEISLPTGSKFCVINDNPSHHKGGLGWAQKLSQAKTAIK